MNLVALSESERETYNRFIMNQSTGSFLQSWEWGEWQESLGREVYRFFVIDNDEPAANNNNNDKNNYNNNYNIIGAVQLIKMPVFGRKFYLYAPYGPVLAEGENFQFPISNFQPLLKEKFPEAMFVRLEPKVDLKIKSDNPGFKKTKNIQPGKTLVLDLRQTADELLAQMHHKTRYNIRLAQRHSVCVSADLAVTPGYGLYFEEALDLIMQTAKRQGFKTFAADYYQKLLDFFGTKNHQNNLKVYVYKALYEKQLLAAAVMVDFGNTRTYLFGGSSEEQKNLMAPHLLHFTAITDAQKSGMEFYDFWGVETASGATPGFVRFKQGFGGKVVEYPGAYDIVFDKFSYNAYRILRYLNRLRF